jgi:hypothetical protein
LQAHRALPSNQKSASVFAAISQSDECMSRKARNVPDKAKTAEADGFEQPDWLLRPFFGIDPEEFFAQMLRAQAVFLDEAHRTTKEFAVEFLLQAEETQRSPGRARRNPFPGVGPMLDEKAMLSLMQSAGSLALKLSRRMERHFTAFAQRSAAERREGGAKRSDASLGTRRYAHIKP